MTLPVVWICGVTFIKCNTHRYRKPLNWTEIVYRLADTVLNYVFCVSIIIVALSSLDDTFQQNLVAISYTWHSL